MTCNILVLEDEALIATDIAMTLEEAGHKNIVVCYSIEEAMEQITKAIPRVALLDFNLGHKTTCVPVAERLKQSGVPFILMTGYAETMIPTPEEFDWTTRISKPFRNGDMVAKVETALNAGGLD